MNGDRAVRRFKRVPVRVSAAGAMDRGLMAAAALRVGRAGDRVSGALAAALSAAALGRFGAEDRARIRRVHDRAWHALSRYAGVPPVWGRFLFFLVRRLEPRSCIELGTAWGVSGSYQAAALEANAAGSLVTFERSSEWAHHAGEAFRDLDLSRVEQRVGLLDDTLLPELARIGAVDYAYVDADHEMAPNLRYFEAMLPHMPPGAVVVFDDINLSPEMRRMWRAIRAHERVGAAHGLRRMGVVVIDGRG
jgi:predicted O-methyltransferase YrrM